MPIATFKMAIGIFYLDFCLCIPYVPFTFVLTLFFPDLFCNIISCRRGIKRVALLLWGLIPLPCPAPRHRVRRERERERESMQKQFRGLTNTRHVCTYFNDFLMVVPNMIMKFTKMFYIFDLLSALACRVESITMAKLLDVITLFQQTGQCPTK